MRRLSPEGNIQLQVLSFSTAVAYVGSMIMTEPILHLTEGTNERVRRHTIRRRITVGNDRDSNRIAFTSSSRPIPSTVLRG
jgi:hypothetical protein